ncbi:9579_t:CDS:2 [Paraglomus occultum]|uniref:9579_t:CDS:1 n=1 Tax=Paraglomus occultum TaxID=144539 RepID=A0A9N9B4Y0_9GLOM|nr:9579_t:CDS:2 [Paraglomus occultum]
MAKPSFEMNNTRLLRNLLLPVHVSRRTYFGKEQSYKQAPTLSYSVRDAAYDFRSDTVTVPTTAMFEAMRTASLGDDVFEEDRTTNEFEEFIADFTGYESAVFVASGTMGNQLALRTHLTQPPYSVLLDARSHIYNYETGGLAYHSGAHVIPVHPSNPIHMTRKDVMNSLIVSDDVHYAPTRVVALENTLNGTLFPLSEIANISVVARENNVKMHLDGARLWNACAETGDSIKDYAKHFDSISLCFSKGLGAPMGSMLVGSKDFIKKARHFRKVFGGGWRQSGPIAAAAKHALEANYPTRLRETHKLARQFASELSQCGVLITKPVHTNMIWMDISPLGITSNVLQTELTKENIRIFDTDATNLRATITGEKAENDLHLRTWWITRD